MESKKVVDAVELGLSHNNPTWTKDDYLLYYAYIVYRLNGWKYKAMAQLFKDGHEELMMKHPCNIDGLGALMDAIKIASPELYDKSKSIEWHGQQVERYLWPKKRKGN